LITELTPNGALEDDIVATIARLLWRKQNLATLEIAQLAQNGAKQIEKANIGSLRRYGGRIDPAELIAPAERIDPAEREAAIRAAEDQAREELSDRYEFVEIGYTATADFLIDNLNLQDRLDGMIDRCLKRLLFLRGLKSISADSSSTPPKHLAEPSKAA
jgi:hypothetical protein